MLCQFLLYNKVSQLYIHIYIYIPSLLSLLPTPPSHPSESESGHSVVSDS